MPLGGLATAGMIIGGLGGVGKSIFGISQMNKAKQIKPEWAKYEENKLAGQNLGATQNLFYGKNRAFTQAEANIRQAQSNQMSNAQRNATDSATLLATGAGAAENANQAFSNLAGQEAQQQAGVLDNLSRAYAMSINEGDKVQANKLMKYQLDSQAQSALRESGMNNIFGGISDVAGGMIQAGGMKKTVPSTGAGAASSLASRPLSGLDSSIVAQQRYAPITGKYSAPREFAGRMPNITPNYRGIPMASAGTTGIPYIPSWGRQ
jgi:hypothetical protein